MSNQAARAQAPAPEAAVQAAAFPVSIRVDAARPIGAMKPMWRFFGADEPNYATMKDGRKLLGEWGELSHRSGYFRAHNLLSSGDGTPALKWGSTNAYTEDAAGNAVYSWKIVDEIFDAYLANGVRPLVQIGFMPQALSVHPEPYQHSWRPGLKYSDIITGWAYPPKSYEKWGELAFRWAEHCVERYGRAEVEKWYWEVWNEPDGDYWKGSRQDFHKLHDFAAAGVRRALPTARVGGPHTAGAGSQFTRDFLEHCLRGTNYATGKVGTPLDYVGFHAKGRPEFVGQVDGAGGHVRMGIANQLRAIDGGFALVASYPELKNTPIIIGESDPDGCAACQGPQLGYRNGTMYSSYTAASFARKYLLADKRGVNLEGALTWAFEFENQPFFAGFRVLASNGLDLPVLNVFRMMGKMSGQRLSVQSSAEVGLEAILKDGVREQPDVSALASLDGNKLSILVWHYHDDDVPGPSANVELALSGLPWKGALKATHFRIDQKHSNSFAAWQSMGSPSQPSAQQYAALEQAGHLAALSGAEAPAQVLAEGGAATLRFELPRQGVSLIVLEAAGAAG